MVVRYEEYRRHLESGGELLNDEVCELISLGYSQHRECSIFQGVAAMKVFANLLFWEGLAFEIRSVLSRL